MGFSDKLPENFLQLKNINTLEFVGSDFDFSLLYFYKPLKDLELRLTAFTSFNDSVKHLQNFEKLSIGSSGYLGNLPSAFSTLHKLKYLEIDYGLGNNMYKCTIDTKQAYAIIQKMKSLEQLKLGKYFTDIYPFWLHSNLKYFSYQGNYVLPAEKDLKTVLHKITVKTDWKCSNMNKINKNIICKE